MLTGVTKKKVIRLIESLRHSNGGYSNLPSGNPDPQATLSCLKIYEMFQQTPPEPDLTFDFLKNLYNPLTSAFKNPVNNSDNVFASAGCLLGINNLGAKEFLKNISGNCLVFMSNNASVREEHFMTIGVVDECKLDFQPQNAINYFLSELNKDGNFGNSVLNNAICASALLRAGIKPENLSSIISIVLNSQTKEGGFSEDGTNPNLWVSYCVMRLLDLSGVCSYDINILSWLENNINELIAGDGDNFSANLLYQNLSIINWVINPLFKAVSTGDNDALRLQIKRGFSKSIVDLNGWSLLQKSSSRGNSEIVEYLLNDTDSIKANADYIFEPADATAIYFAGQSGDLKTIQILLKHNPESLFSSSRINGHTLILQLVFFGSEKHIESIKWIFENLENLFKGKNKEEISELQKKLSSASNVRGYNISSMAQLWGNTELKKVAESYDISTEESRKDYLNVLLENIASYDSEIYSKNNSTEEFVSLIINFFKELSSDVFDIKTIDNLKEKLINDLKTYLSLNSFDINQLGGALSETPLIVAVTGVDLNVEKSKARYEICKFLLDSGSDPDKEEIHPMSVDAVIRASVLNHFDILKLISNYMKPLAFRFAMNRKPAVNGQTALQDSVHRALTSQDDSFQNHLEQIKWMISKGADIDIEDHTGKSPRKLALNAKNDAIFKANAEKVINILGIN